MTSTASSTRLSQLGSFLLSQRVMSPGDRPDLWASSSGLRPRPSRRSLSARLLTPGRCLRAIDRQRKARVVLSGYSLLAAVMLAGGILRKLSLGTRSPATLLVESCQHVPLVGLERTSR